VRRRNLVQAFRLRDRHGSDHRVKFGIIDYLWRWRHGDQKHWPSREGRQKFQKPVVKTGELIAERVVAAERHQNEVWFCLVSKALSVMLECLDRSPTNSRIDRIPSA